MRPIRTAVSAGTALGAVLALGFALPPAAQAALEPVGSGASQVFVVDGTLYAVSLGAYEVQWGDSLSATQAGDVQVRKFRPREGGETPRFGKASSLGIMGVAPAGMYLGSPQVFPVRSGLVFCRVNLSATSTGRGWSVDTAVFSTTTRSWSALRRTPLASATGQYGGCLGAVGDPDQQTVVVEQRAETLGEQRLFSLMFAGSAAPAIRSYAQSTGSVSGAESYAEFRVAVNAATGLVDLYEGDKIPVTVSVYNYVRRDDGTLRRANRYQIVFFDVARKRWTEPRQAFTSGMEASEDVVGETALSGIQALVSPDAQTLHLLAGFRRITSVPEWPSVPVTSVGRVSLSDPSYQGAFVVGVSSEDAQRRDWLASSGWTLSFTDDSGPHLLPASIRSVGAERLVVFVGYGAAFTPTGTVRNARIAFTGNSDNDDNAELEWTRLMQETSLGVFARTLRNDRISAVTTLPGARVASGNSRMTVRHAAVIDGTPVVIIGHRDFDTRGMMGFRSRLTSSSFLSGAWKRPQVVVGRYDDDMFDEPMAFMPFGARTALIGAQSDLESPGVYRRVFSGGRWGDARYIRPVTSGGDQVVPVVARVLGADGPVEVEIITRNPSVAITGATYDPNERINDSSYGTVTFSYTGTIPRSPSGFVAVNGWQDAFGWDIGSTSPVIDVQSRTIKMSVPITPTASAPTTPARIVWGEMLETVYVVNRRL